MAQADVTAFNVQGDRLSLWPVLDLYNGEIIAYETQENPRMPLVSEVLKKALSKLGNGEAPMLPQIMDDSIRWVHANASLCPKV